MSVRLPVFFALLLVSVAASAQTPPLFEPYSTYPLAQEAQTVAIGDLNGDGRNDAAVAAWPSALYVMYQNADGLLDPPAEFAAPTMPLGLAIADLDGDGLKDLAIGGVYGEVWLYYQQLDGALSLPTICGAAGDISSIAIADLNMDGLQDLVVGASDSSGSAYSLVAVLRQGSDGIFGLPTLHWFSGANGRCVSVLDYNSDGKLDIALLVENTVCYLTQDGGGQFGEPHYLPAQWAHSMVAGDVTGDGLADLAFTVATNRPEATVGVYAQAAGGPQLASYAAYDYAEALALVDLDGDGRQDVVAAHAGWEALTVFHQTPTGALSVWEPYPLTYCNYYAPGAVAAGDLNSDGLPDVAVADWWNGLTVFLHTRPSDGTAPTCTADISGQVGLNGWLVTPATVTLSAGDDPGGSGVKTIVYTLDGSTWQPYVEPISVGTQGLTRIDYYAEDFAGNRSTTDWVEVMIDNAAPRLAVVPTTSTISSGKTADVPIDIRASDATSGLAALHLQVVDEYSEVQTEVDVTPGTVSVHLDTSVKGNDRDGRVYTLTLTGADLAGNTSLAVATITVVKARGRK